MSQAKFINRSEPFWQDKEVRFDVSSLELKLRTGEKVIESFPNVEDSKGNAGESGTSTLTNLRLIWQSKAKPRINLSIGLGCISSITNRTIHYKIRGTQEALYIMTRVNGTRYEFIFSKINNQNHDDPGLNQSMVEIITKACRAYAATRLYRDLKLRSAVITPNGKQLKMLPTEQIYNKINGVWNLSSDQGNLGTMHLTNIRIVWHANMNELFNISLPYLQISAIKVRESKFGIALVIESTESSGGYVLGFRIDPPERLNGVFNELVNLYNIHSANPDLGVENNLQLISSSGSVFNDVQVHQSDGSSHSSINTEIKEIDEENEAGKHDAIAAYLADDGHGKDNDIVYSTQLGLAIERIKEGFTLESLWNVIPQN